MMPSWSHGCTKFNLAIAVMGCFAIASSTSSALAQITPDTTLGNQNSTVTSTGAVDEINGGATRGANLFHSFQEFNVGNGRSALFINPPEIENILSRVTGANPSNILGTLGRANGNANLFLINPHGIVFGANASLNIGGSFVASTANAVQFGNIGFFSATDQNIPSQLLTVNPSALLFNQINQNAAIQNNSAAPTGTDPAGFDVFGLQVPDGKSLLLVGSNVSMDGGQLNAYSGRVELGGLTESGTVLLGVDGDNLSLIFPENVARTSVSLTNQAGIYVEGAGGGNIAVNARNLEILGGSVLSAGIGQGLGTPETVAGDITLNATGEIRVAGNESEVSNVVGLGSKGNGGNIIINSGSFSLQDGASLTASTYGQGNAGNVIVRALNDVSLTGASIFSTVESGGVGKGGDININAATLSFIDGAELQTITREESDTQPAGQGDVGNVNINVTGAVDIAGRRDGLPGGGIFSFLETGAVGNGGNITINSGSFSLRDGARLDASTLGQGNAGNVTVQAREAVSVTGAEIRSRVEPRGVGNGGDININAATVSLIGAELQAATSGQGNGGNVIVRALNAVSLANTDLVSRVESSGIGKGGNIDINAATLSLIGAQLRTFTETFDTQSTGQGDTGNVNINVTGAVDIAGNRGTTPSGIFSFVGARPGTGGNITINSGSFSLRDGARIDSSTYGQGNAGNVTVWARDTVSVAGAEIRSLVEAEAVGKGGNIDIKAATVSLIDGARLTASTDGQGNAGNVIIQDARLVFLDGQSQGGSPSGLFARTMSSGNAGELIVNTGQLIVQNGAQVSADTFGAGRAGSLRVNATDAVTVEGNNSRLNFDTASQSANAGDAGDLRINTPRLMVRDGGRVSARTSNTGRAGTLAVNADLVEVNGTGSGLFFDSSSSGNAQGIRIETGQLVIQNGGQVTVNGTGSGNPGDLEVTADSILLNNNGKLTTETASGNGGNIRLRVQDEIRMRYQSEISASAQGIGNGGNVEIEIPNGFILAFLPENSDIVASAIQGNGGVARATAAGVFGFRQFRGFRTPESDFTASSELGINGKLEIITPDRRLEELPADFEAAEIAQGCEAIRGQEGSRFVVTGRGGLPPNPKEALSSDDVQVDWVPLNSEQENRSTSTVSTKTTNATPAPLVEAQGWVINDKGQVVLIATAPTVTPHSPWQTPNSCGAPQSKAR